MINTVMEVLSVRTWIILILVLSAAVFVFGYAQQKPNPPAAQPALKQGSITFTGKPISFFHRADIGTFRLNGQGVVLVSDLKGTIQVKGFQAMKQFPADVKLTPEYANRVRVFSGSGTLTISGTYQSVRAFCREAKLVFNGNGNFVVSGQGHFVQDGKTTNLFATSTRNVFVPAWNYQPPPSTPPAGAPAKPSTVD